MANPKDYGLQYRGGIRAPTASQIAAQRVPVAAAIEQVGTPYELHPTLDWSSGPDLADILGGLVPLSETLATSQNDWSPTNWAAANLIRINPTANINITGFDANVSKTVRFVVNVNPTYTVTLVYNSGLSVEANRIYNGNGDKILSENDCVIVFYDTIAVKWRTVLI